MTILEHIEAIRKNPRAFIENHQAKTDKSLESETTEMLLSLMVAAANISYEMAFRRIEEILASRQEIAESQPYAFVYAMAKGIFTRSIQQYQSALEWYIRAYDIAHQIGDIDGIARIQIYLSSIFRLLKQRDTGMEFAKQAIALAPRCKNTALIADIYAIYGMMLHHLGDYKACLATLSQAEDYYLKLPDAQEYLNYCILLINFGEIYTEAGMIQMGENYYNRALGIAHKNGFFPFLQAGIKAIAQYYLKNDAPYKAFELLMDYINYSEQSVATRLYVSDDQASTSLLHELVGMAQLRLQNTQLAEELSALQGIAEQGGMDDLALEKLRRMAKGIKQGEFIPYVQEKRHLKDQVLTGVEVLLRWQQTPDILLAPGHFIDLLENNPLIFQLFEQVAHNTLRSLSKLIRTQLPTLVVSFNVSPYQLAHQDILKLFDTLIVTYGLSPLNLEIEIIERTFIERHPVALEQLAALHRKGYGIALDDFGSGYSSLSCIVDLPVDTVKIDRSLTKDIVNHYKSEQVFKGIVAMLKGLGILTVAEGIETQDQLQKVIACGCAEGQGYYWHKPEPLDTFTLRHLNQTHLSNSKKDPK